VPDKKHLAKRQALGKEPDSDSEAQKSVNVHNSTKRFDHEFGIY
jgi:hypothetical protein